MTEKVLKFKEKYGEKYFRDKDRVIVVKKKDLVPVRLKKESVGLKWLERYCADTRTKVWKDGTKAFIDVDALLSAVRAKAKKANK